MPESSHLLEAVTSFIEDTVQKFAPKWTNVIPSGWRIRRVGQKTLLFWVGGKLFRIDVSEVKKPDGP